MSTAPLLVTASPHLKAPVSTPKIMWHVVFSLVPVWAASIYYFGPSAILVVAATTLGCVLPERFFGKRGALGDGSCVITGMLLGLTLPPGVPLWMAFVGGVFAIAFGKLVFGGLGQNPFNPALVGRAFLQASFPVALTTWPAAPTSWFSFYPSNFAWPLMRAPDVVTQPTPLSIMKWPADQPPLPEFSNMLFGSTGGSLGETAGVLILLCGGYLALRNFLNWRIPASILLTVGLFTGVLYLIDDQAFAAPQNMLFSGGLMLGAMYMATDMVTSPTTNRGCWIFGFGIGFLVVVIRVWGGLPEGVQYSILLMNALVPFLNRWTQPRVFGTGKAPKPEAAS